MVCWFFFTFHRILDSFLNIFFNTFNTFCNTFCSNFFDDTFLQRQFLKKLIVANNVKGVWLCDAPAEVSDKVFCIRVLVDEFRFVGLQLVHFDGGSVGNNTKFGAFVFKLFNSAIRYNNSIENFCGISGVKSENFSTRITSYYQLFVLVFLKYLKDSVNFNLEFSRIYNLGPINGGESFLVVLIESQCLGISTSLIPKKDTSIIRAGNERVGVCW